MPASALCACVGGPGVFLTTQLNFALCPTRVRRQVFLHSRASTREVCCCSVCARLCGVLKRVSSVGRMLLPATHVHTRAVRVLPSRSTVSCSNMCGPRGVLVPSQAGVATQVCWVLHRAFLAGQDLVAERSSFVARPPRSSCHKLSGVLTVRPDASVWSPCRCPEESLPSVSRQQRVLHPTCP